MNEECLICRAPLEYLDADTEMECVFCRKKCLSKTRCTNGHFVCDACHMGSTVCLSAPARSRTTNAEWKPARFTAREGSLF